MFITILILLAFINSAFSSDTISVHKYELTESSSPKLELSYYLSPYDAIQELLMCRDFQYCTITLHTNNKLVSVSDSIKVQYVDDVYKSTYIEARKSGKTKFFQTVDTTYQRIVDTHINDLNFVSLTAKRKPQLDWLTVESVIMSPLYYLIGFGLEAVIASSLDKPYSAGRGAIAGTVFSATYFGFRYYEEKNNAPEYQIYLKVLTF